MNSCPRVTILDHTYPASPLHILDFTDVKEPFEFPDKSIRVTHRYRLLGPMI